MHNTAKLAEAGIPQNFETAYFCGVMMTWYDWTLEECLAFLARREYPKKNISPLYGVGGAKGWSLIVNGQLRNAKKVHAVLI